VIFVTVGGSGEPFPRLTRALEQLPLGEVVLQRGPNPAPAGIRHCEQYMDFAAILDHMERADVVVSHAGAGSVVCARRAGHVPIVIPRLARFGETVDDHQAEFAAALGRAGQAIVVWNTERLSEAVEGARPRRAWADAEAHLRPLREAVREAIYGRGAITA
jgi:UDP-N-acetylglucosamine transferase subunit ALG13